MGLMRSNLTSENKIKKDNTNQRPTREKPLVDPRYIQHNPLVEIMEINIPGEHGFKCIA